MQRLKSKRKKPGGENSEDKKDNSQSVTEEKEKEHIFQYGLIPMKHIQGVGEHQDILRQINCLNLHYLPPQFTLLGRRKLIVKYLT